MPFANFHASRQADPAQFERFATKKNQGGAGIDFILGFKPGGGSEVQSIRFAKSKFTAAQAKAWLKAHKFKTTLEATVSEARSTSGLSFDQIRELVSKALQATFPPVNVNEDDQGWAWRYSIDRLWTDRVLVCKSYRWSKETDPKYGLLRFTVVEEDKTPRVDLGDLVPMKIQAVSDDGAETLTLDERSKSVASWLQEAGKRHSKSDAAALNATLRTLISLLPQTDVEEETLSAFNAKLLAPIATAEAEKDAETPRPGDPATEPGEEPETDPDPSPAIVDPDPDDDEADDADDEMAAAAWKEGQSGLAGELWTESFQAPLADVKIDKATLVLHNTVVLGPVSTNGRQYPVETQKKALPLFEGSKAYLNHPRTQDMGEARQVQDLIGEHKNVRVEGDRTVSDLHLLDTPLVQETVLPIAESKPHLFGNSIVARGKMTKAEDGTLVVEEILAVRSVDLVAEPATTNGLFAEGHKNDELGSENDELRIHNSQFTIHNSLTEETTMEWKDLTLEALTEKRKDLIEAILATAKEAERLKQLETDLAAATAQIKEKDTKITALEIKEAKRTKEAVIERLVRDAKIPDTAKYDEKDGAKSLKPHVHNLLNACETEEQMKAVIADWEAVAQGAQKATPVSEEKKVTFGNGEVTEQDAARLYRAFME